MEMQKNYAILKKQTSDEIKNQGICVLVKALNRKFI